MDEVAALQEQANYETFIDDQVKLLSTGDETEVTKALAGLVIAVAQLPDPTIPASLLESLPNIISCLESPNLEIQKNAAAALTAILGLNEDVWHDLTIEKGLVSKSVSALSQALEANADPTDIANFVALVVTIAQGGEEGARAVLDAGGVTPVFAACKLNSRGSLQEAAADAICQIATYEGYCREELSQLGAVEFLAGLLMKDEVEVQVRALMGLGMLLPNSQANQLKIAGDGTAMKVLLAMMQQNEDTDIKIISRDLFVGLVQKHKDVVEQSLRSEAEPEA